MSARNWHMRRGASQVVTGLLVLTIVALVGVIVVLALGRGDGNDTGEGGGNDSNLTDATNDSSSSDTPGETRQRPEPVELPRPERVGDPERIRDVLQEGKTYESTVKIGFQAQVIDADWGVRTTVTIVYEAENRMRRTVEQNDGQTVVLLCHMLDSRAAKLLTDAEVRFDLGQPGFLPSQHPAEGGWFRPNSTSASHLRALSSPCNACSTATPTISSHTSGVTVPAAIATYWSSQARGGRPGPPGCL